MDPQKAIEELLELNGQLTTLAEEAVAAKEAAETELKQFKDTAVTLQKVASDKVGGVIDALAGAHMLPEVNRDKVASLLGTHEGALDVLRSVIHLTVSPEDGGTPVPNPAAVKTASVAGAGSRDPKVDSRTAELQLWADLARTGF